MIIGVTGDIGTGKSTAAKFLKEFSKGEIINVDKLGWEILEKRKAKLIDTFGEKIITRGKIDRKKLGKIVFNDKNKLRLLNSIIHPLLVKELKNRILKIPDETVKIVDCALIYQWEIEKWFDRIIVVTSSYESRQKRTKKLKYNKEIIDNIMKSQIVNYGQDKCDKLVDIIIDNNLSLSVLRAKVKKIWVSLLLAIGQ
jgi:dephospho-CoA kinase